jgi:cytidylate kinase
MRRLTVAIDGPAGAGKSTVARKVAQTLGYQFLDSGAMYRCVGLLSIRQNVDLEDKTRMTAIAEAAQISFVAAPDISSGEGQRVILDGEDVTDAIRTPDVSQRASQVAAISGVRAEMVKEQQKLGRDRGVVMEGRDIGTVVFPHAEVKIFLTASNDERVRRRLIDLQAKGDTEMTFEALKAQMQQRDERDSTREDSPLHPAEDAILLLTDGLTIPEVVAEILELVQARLEEV